MAYQWKGELELYANVHAMLQDPSSLQVCELSATNACMQQKYAMLIARAASVELYGGIWPITTLKEVLHVEKGLL